MPTAPYSPCSAPDTPDPYEQLERRRTELREGIEALSRAEVQYRADGYTALADAEKALIAELRHKLAELGATDVLGQPGTAAGP